MPDILSRITTKRNDETRDHPGRTLHHIFPVHLGRKRRNSRAHQTLYLNWLGKMPGSEPITWKLWPFEIKERRIWNWRLSRNPQPVFPCLYGVKLWQILQHSFGENKEGMAVILW